MSATSGGTIPRAVASERAAQLFYSVLAHHATEEQVRPFYLHVKHIKKTPLRGERLAAAGAAAARDSLLHEFGKRQTCERDALRNSLTTLLKKRKMPVSALRSTAHSHNIPSPPHSQAELADVMAAHCLESWGEPSVGPGVRCDECMRLAASRAHAFASSPSAAAAATSAAAADTPADAALTESETSSDSESELPVTLPAPGPPAPASSVDSSSSESGSSDESSDSESESDVDLVVAAPVAAAPPAAAAASAVAAAAPPPPRAAAPKPSNQPSQPPSQQPSRPPSQQTSRPPSRAVGTGSSAFLSEILRLQLGAISLDLRTRDRFVSGGCESWHAFASRLAGCVAAEAREALAEASRRLPAASAGAYTLRVLPPAGDLRAISRSDLATSSARQLERISPIISDDLVEVIATASDETSRASAMAKGASAAEASASAANSAETDSVVLLKSLRHRSAEQEEASAWRDGCLGYVTRVDSKSGVLLLRLDKHAMCAALGSVDSFSSGGELGSVSVHLLDNVRTEARQAAALQSIGARPAIRRWAEEWLLRAPLEPPAPPPARPAQAAASPSSLPAPLCESLGRIFNAAQRAAIFGCVRAAESGGSGSSLGGSSGSSSGGVVLLHGPPGTGKTTCVIGIISALLAMPPRVPPASVASIAKPRLGGSSLPSLMPKNGRGGGGGRGVGGRGGGGVGDGVGSSARRKLLVCAPSNAALDEIVRRLLLADGTGGIIDEIGRRRSLLPPLSPSGQLTGRARVVRLGDTSKLAPAAQAVSLERLVGAYHRPNSGGSGKGGGSSAGGSSGGLSAEASRHRVLSEADIVCATCAGAGMELLLEYVARSSEGDGRGERRQDGGQIVSANHGNACPFDAIIIDEATQATEPAVLVALQHGSPLVILAGDDQQLPPT